MYPTASSVYLLCSPSHHLLSRFHMTSIRMVDTLSWIYLSPQTNHLISGSTAFGGYFGLAPQSIASGR